MSRLRRLSPWYWVMLSAVVVACGVLMSNLFLDWAPKWLTSAATMIPLAGAIYTFRIMWKQTDHLAFHSDDGSVKRPMNKRSVSEVTLILCGLLFVIAGVLVIVMSPFDSAPLNTGIGVTAAAAGAGAFVGAAAGRNAAHTRRKKAKPPRSASQAE